jgi:hypothetical protein
MSELTDEETVAVWCITLGFDVEVGLKALQQEGPVGKLTVGDALRAARDKYVEELLLTPGGLVPGSGYVTSVTRSIDTSDSFTPARTVIECQAPMAYWSNHSYES